MLIIIEHMECGRCVVARTNATAGPGAFDAQLLANRLRYIDDQLSYVEKSTATNDDIDKRFCKHSTQRASVVLLSSAVQSVRSTVCKL